MRPPRAETSRLGGGASSAPRRSKIVFPVACRLLKDLGGDGRIGIVLTGAVRLTRQRLDGGRNVLETIGPNDTFGATYVFRDVPTMGISMSAVGDTRVIMLEVGKITRPCHKTCAAHLQFIRNLLTVMSQKTFAMKQKLRLLSARTIRARLMLFLQIRAKQARSNEFEIPFDRQALADYLCVDRSALSAELSKLRRERKVEAVKNRFKLLVS